MSAQAARRDGTPASEVSGAQHPLVRALNTTASVLLILGIAGLVVLAWPHQMGGRFGSTVVVGNSMEGTYRTGDLLITASKSRYGPGDIVVYTVHYEQARGTVVHRVVDEQDGMFTTKGDNNSYPDPWPVRPADIRGEPVLRIPAMGWALLLARTPLMLMLLTGVLVAVLLWPSKTAPAEDVAPDAGWDPPRGPAWPLSPPSGPPAPADTPSPPADPAPTSPQ